MPFDGTQLSPITKALREGRQQIEAGWCQHTARTRDGVCLVASLCDAPDYETVMATHGLLKSAIKQMGFRNVELWEFNDYPGRTKEEVLAVYDDAIGLSFYCPMGIHS